tara:strand:+ start:16794 stop:17078 length:285 start_codon:yes stop_codon:yes gene_type:complete
MPGRSAGYDSEPRYDKKTINMLANMSTRDRNKFVRDNASAASGGGGMKGLAKGAKTTAKEARAAGDRDTAKAARKLARKADRTVARRKARRAAK